MAEFEIERSDDTNRIYIAVDGKFDVVLIRTDEGLIVDVFPFQELHSVASTYAFDSDVESNEQAE